MSEKKEETRNREAFSGAFSDSGSPVIGCASDFSTTYAGLQETIYKKFVPKRKRAEAVAGLYDALARRFDGMGAECIQAYLEFDKDKAFEKVWSLMHFQEGEALLKTVRGLLFRWYSEHAFSVNGCGTELEYHVPLTDGGGVASLVHANFCRDRMCPLCNWRRSLKVFGQVSKIMNELDGCGYRYLFLTLTVRNVWGAELSDAVQALYDGWRVLYNKYMEGPYRSAEKRLKNVVAGTFRALEVTVSDGRYSPEWAGSFHPHLHVILAVEPSYFKRGRYLDESDWQELWRKACRLDYDPSIKIEAVRPKDVGRLDVPTEAGKPLDYSGAVAELSKYPLKDADFLCDEKYSQPEGQYMDWLLKALRRRRLLGLTGCFREVSRALLLDDMESGDLVNVDGGDGAEPVEALELRDDVQYMVLKYKWQCGVYVESAFMHGEDFGYEKDETYRLTPEDVTPEVAERWKRRNDGHISDDTCQSVPESVTPEIVERRKRRKRISPDELKRGERSEWKAIRRWDDTFDYGDMMYLCCELLGYDMRVDFVRVAFGGKIRCFCMHSEPEKALDLYRRVVSAGLVPADEFSRFAASCAK